MSEHCITHHTVHVHRNNKKNLVKSVISSHSGAQMFTLLIGSTCVSHLNVSKFPGLKPCGSSRVWSGKCVKGSVELTGVRWGLFIESSCYLQASLPFQAPLKPTFHPDSPLELHHFCVLLPGSCPLTQSEVLFGDQAEPFNPLLLL